MRILKQLATSHTFIVFSEAHLRRILKAYAGYYNEVRTRLSLGKNAPFPRAAQRIGQITALPLLGGLHHQDGEQCGAGYLARVSPWLGQKVLASATALSFAASRDARSTSGPYRFFSTGITVMSVIPFDSSHTLR